MIMSLKARSINMTGLEEETENSLSSGPKYSPPADVLFAQAKHYLQRDWYYNLGFLDIAINKISIFLDSYPPQLSQQCFLISKSASLTIHIINLQHQRKLLLDPPKQKSKNRKYQSKHPQIGSLESKNRHIVCTTLSPKLQGLILLYRTRQQKLMNEFISIQVDLPRRKSTRQEIIYRRIIRKGFPSPFLPAKDTLDTIEEIDSPLKRYKTQRNQENLKIENEFIDFTAESIVNSAVLKTKKDRNFEKMPDLRQSHSREKSMKLWKSFLPKIQTLRREDASTDRTNRREKKQQKKVNLFMTDELITFYPHKPTKPAQ